jgi:chorismate mutase/prephenate dehydratase
VNLTPAQREATNAIRFLREQIDAIDLQVVALLVQRARLAVRIGEVKEYAELPVVELNREQQVLQRVEKLRSEPLDAESAHQIFTSIMLSMRRLQSRGRGDEAEDDTPPPIVKKKSAAKKRR